MIDSFLSVFQEMEKREKQLQSDIEELKKEIAQRHIESKTLREDLEATNRQIVLDNKEYEKLVDELENLKVSFEEGLSFVSPTKFLLFD